MELGFSALALSEISFEEVVDFAVKNGFSSVEFVCIPKDEPGVHHIDVEGINKETAGDISRMLKEKNVAISCLSYYSNPLYNDEAREKFTVYFRKMIDAAMLLGVKNISTFTGYSSSKNMAENIDLFAKTFEPLIEHAKNCGVNILLENAPHISGNPRVGNFAYSPQMWDAIFTRVHAKNLGLNYDPSHLFWQGIDYILFLKLFAERLFHVQASDSEIALEQLRITGMLGSEWFRYRLAGWGAINWKSFIHALYSAGYNGVISIENADSEWLENIDKAMRGILLAKREVWNNLIEQ